MFRQFVALHIVSRRHINSSRVLLGVWFVGLSLGILYAFYAGDYLISLMRGCVFSSVSFVDLLEICLLPILLSAMAVWLSEPICLHLICFAKAALFGFCGCGISLAFGNGGWIVRGLLLFSDVLTMPALLLFCTNALSPNRSHSANLTAYIVYCCAVAFVDFWVISPFIADIF